MPKTNIQKIQTLYKKQIPDMRNHLEIEEIVIQKQIAKNKKIKEILENK